MKSVGILAPPKSCWTSSKPTIREAVWKRFKRNLCLKALTLAAFGPCEPHQSQLSRPGLISSGIIGSFAKPYKALSSNAAAWLLRKSTRSNSFSLDCGSAAQRRGLQDCLPALKPSELSSASDIQANRCPNQMRDS